MADKQPQQPQDLASFFAPQPEPQGAPTAAPPSSPATAAPQGPTPAGEAPVAPPVAAPVADTPPELPATEPGAPQQPQGFFSKATAVVKSIVGQAADANDAVSNVAAGVAVGALRSPGQAIGGVLDTGGDLAKAVAGDTGKALYDASIKYTTPIGLVDRIATGSWNTPASYADVLSSRDTLGKVGQSAVNQATTNLGALAIGGEALSGLKAFSWAPKIVKGALEFGTASGIINKSSGEERFTNALQALGVHSEFTDWLASDPKNAGAMESRFKNALDGALTGAAFDTVFTTAKYVWSAVKGKAPEVLSQAAKDAEDAAKAATAPDAQPTEMETFKTNPGKIASEHAAEVSSVEAQGTAGAAAKAGPADGPVVFTVKPKGSDFQPRAVGGMRSEEDLQRFYDEANKLIDQQAGALDVTEQNAPELFQRIGRIKLLPFASPDDVPAFMRAVLDNAPAIERPMSDESLNHAVARGAAALGLDKNAYDAFLRNFATEAKQLPQAVGISRAGWASIVKDISTNAARGTDNLTTEELRQHLDTVFTARSWGAHILDIKAGLGRGLRAWQLPAVNPDSYFQQFGSKEAFDVLPEGADAAGSMPPLPRNLKELDNFYKLWAAAGGDDAARAELLQGRNIIPKPGWYLRNAVANTYTGSLLAGTAIVKGYVMPGFMGAIQTLERTAGAGLASLNPMLSPEDRQAFAAIAKATPMAYFQTLGDFTSAFRYSIDATRNGGNTIIGGGYSAKDAAQRLGPVTEEMLQAAGGKTNDWRYSAGNAINVWPRVVFSLIGGQDELTKRLSYLGRVRMHAWTFGLKNGMHGQDLEDFIRGAISDAVDPATGAAVYPDVLNEAARTSFMNKPAGPMAETIHAVNKARHAVPELRFVMPVLNVPASSLGESIRRIPILSAIFRESRDDLLGTNGTTKQAEAYGRWITGATLIGTGFGLARNGILTGAGPANAADKHQWENNGYQPFSIKVPGIGWVSYNAWEPLGAILGIIGTVYDHTVYHAEDDQTHSKVLAAIAALAEYAKDKAAMKGVSAIINFGDPNDSESYFTRLIGSTASGFVPAFVRNMRNAGDPNLRVKNSAWDYVLNSIPGASPTLPPLRNVLGEPIHTPNEAYNLFGLLPITIASAKATGSDPVTDELDKIYQITGYAGGVVHPASLSGGAFDTKDLRLENGQTLFDAYAQSRLKTDNPAFGGKNVEGFLKDLFASDAYKNAAYGSATHLTDVNGTPSKVAMVRKVFDAADEWGRISVARDSAKARQYLAIANAKADNPNLLRNYTADQLASTPSLFKALNIPIDLYEKKAAGQ